MKIKMNRSVGNSAGVYTRGQEYDIDEGLGEAWVRTGVADDVTPDPSETDVEDLSVRQLRKVLADDGQPTGGNKAELVERVRALRESDDQEEGDGGEDGDAPAGDDGA